MSAPRTADAILEGEWRGQEVWTYGRDFGGQALAPMLRETVRLGGRLVVFDGFFRDAVAESFLSPGELDARKIDLARLRASMRRVHVDDELGATWMVAPGEAQSLIHGEDTVPPIDAETRP